MSSRWRWASWTARRPSSSTVRSSPSLPLPTRSQSAGWRAASCSANPSAAAATAAVALVVAVAIGGLAAAVALALRAVFGGGAVDPAGVVAEDLDDVARVLRRPPARRLGAGAQHDLGVLGGEQPSQRGAVPAAER